MDVNNYLKLSIRKTYFKRVCKYKQYNNILSKEAYEYLISKTELLINKVLKVNYFRLTNVFLAACFWIVNKYCDDDSFYRGEILKGFDLHEKHSNMLDNYEGRILKSIGWNLEFIRANPSKSIISV